MNKSGRVRLRDLQRAHRLIHDCRDVGHDPAAWPVVLIEGLALLLDAQVCMMGAIDMESDAATSRRVPRSTVLAERGWISPEHRAVWEKAHLEAEAFQKTVSFRQFAAVPGHLVTRSREQLVDDGAWYRSEEFNECNRLCGTDDLLASATRTNHPPSMELIALNRALGMPRFLPRDRRLVRLFHGELATHIGVSLARKSGGPLRPLPPRLRQTLRYLLDGDSEKQVALRMGLSRHTVHEYVHELYRRMGVTSRPELMAYCFRHRIHPE